jgi:opacity protein-like surface antigen
MPAFADSSADVEAVSDGIEVSAIDALKGFSIGAGIAYDYSDLKTTVDEFVGEKNENTETYKTKRSGLDPYISLGYGHFFKNWYVGGAADVSFGKKCKNEIVNEDKDQDDIKIDGVSYGIKLKGGYYLCRLKTVVYGIAGVKWRESSYAPMVGSDSAPSKVKLKSPYWLVGIGFERPVWKKLSVVGEYQYAWRSSAGTRNVGKKSDVDLNVDANLKLRDHTFKIGVNYHI